MEWGGGLGGGFREWRMDEREGKRERVRVESNKRGRECKERALRVSNTEVNLVEFEKEQATWISVLWKIMRVFDILPITLV